jgi:uncharacterized protein
MRSGTYSMTKTIAALLAAPAFLFMASPAFANAKVGVDAWERGDYATAIKSWRPLAIKGDADAQFNLAQAYRFGRGVPMDLKQAEDWYRRAATQGHLQAEDNLGLIMFQNGDRQNALPYIERSATRGEPRAQYVLGTSLFNGDFGKKDWVRAYALMTRASAAGLPRASSSLAQMDRFIPLSDRQKGLAMARDMELNASRSVAALPPARVAAAPQFPAAPYPQQTYPSAAPQPAPQPPIWRNTPSAPRSVPIEPSIAQMPPPPVYAEPQMSDEVAVAEPAFPPVSSRPAPVKSRKGALGTTSRGALPPPRRSTRQADPELPPQTDVLPPEPSYPVEPSYPAPMEAPVAYPDEAYPSEPSYPAPVAMPRPAAPRSAPVVRKPAVAAPKAPVRQAMPASGGKYRVQLGAFSEEAKARALWQSLRGRISGLGSMQPYLVKAGSVTRLQAGPFSSRAAADKTCASARAAGNGCLVVSP